MSHRLLTLLGVLAAVVAIVSPAAMPVAGPTLRGSFVGVAEASGEGAQVPAANQAASAKPYAPPRTPWSDPDLQGIWTSDGVAGVPIERPKEVLTEEELAKREREQALARQVDRGVTRGITA